MNITIAKKVSLFTLVLATVFMFGASCSKPATTVKGDPRAAQVAQALTDAEVKFYGASWCPHCAEQKQMFGDAVKQLPYIECSTPDKQHQTQVCIDAAIKAYPTWDFGAGEQGNRDRYEGVLTIDQLIDKAHLSIASADQPGPIPPK